MASDLPFHGPAVVTGAASGIGRALVLELVARGVDRVIAADRDLVGAKQTAQLAGNRVAPLALDVSDPEAVAAAAASVAGRHGPIAAWFSNAGIHTSDGLGAAGDWRRALDVNLLAHVYAAQAVLPGMEARSKGAFVITASAAGLMMDLRAAIYTASKHAAVALAEWLAVSVADGVSVHCVCPEGVQTAMTRPNSAAAGAGIAFLSAEEVAHAVLDGVTEGRFLILTHPTTADFERRRVADRPRWLAGMRRARRSALQIDRLFPTSTGL